MKLLTYFSLAFLLFLAVSCGKDNNEATTSVDNSAVVQPEKSANVVAEQATEVPAKQVSDKAETASQTEAKPDNEEVASKKDADILKIEKGEFKPRNGYKFPKKLGFCLDTHNYIGSSSSIETNGRLDEHHKITGRDIYIVFVETLGPYPNTQLYANDLFEAWDLDENGKGALVVYCHILEEVGLTLSPAIGKQIPQRTRQKIVHPLIDKFTPYDERRGLHHRVLDRLIFSWPRKNPITKKDLM